MQNVSSDIAQSILSFVGDYDDLCEIRTINKFWKSQVKSKHVIDKRKKEIASNPLLYKLVEPNYDWIKNSNDFKHRMGVLYYPNVEIYYRKKLIGFMYLWGFDSYECSLDYFMIIDEYNKPSITHEIFEYLPIDKLIMDSSDPRGFNNLTGLPENEWLDPYDDDDDYKEFMNENYIPKRKLNYPIFNTDDDSDDVMPSGSYKITFNIGIY